MKRDLVRERLAGFAERQAQRDAGRALRNAEARRYRTTTEAPKAAWRSRAAELPELRSRTHEAHTAFVKPLAKRKAKR